MKIFLTFDIGTTSVKGCAFDERFHRVASVNEEYALLTPRPHFVEMDPEAYWQAVTDGARRMIAGGIEPKDVACVTFTTQGETMIPVDREGKALSKAIVWLDDRAQREAALLSEAIPGDVFYRHTGVPELSAATPLAKLCWHARQAKEIHERTYKYLLLEDWLILRMTGRFVTEQSLLSSTGYFDIVRRRYWTRALEACGVTEDRLPEAVPCGTQVGGVTRAAAEQTGLVEGTPVIAGAMDQICAAMGAGNVREGVLAENTGTCLAVTATSETPVFDESKSVQVYAHFDHRYLLLAYNPTAAVVLKWFKDAFMQEYRRTLPEDANIYDAMTAEAAGVPPLSEGVTVIPHFSGRLFPDADPEMRGAFVGLSLGTGRAHCIRAILESVAYMLRQSVEAMEKLGIEAKEIRSVGGASVSELWNRIKSSATHLPTVAMEESESTALGAAMLGALGVGAYADAEEICDRFIRPEKSYAPSEEESAAYDRVYARFVEINRRLSDLRVDQ